MTVREMFNTATKVQVWGVEGYEAPLHYVDARK